MTSDSIRPTDPYDLERFVSAQAGSYERALAELRAGRKRTHWMWFVFPQYAGLGFSSTSNHYAIKSRDEAVAYLRHPLLGARLRECTEAVLAVEGRSVSEIFGSPDDLKLRSSMTLFDEASGEEDAEDPAGTTPYRQLLVKYFRGEPDARTLSLLGPRGGRFR